MGALDPDIRADADIRSLFPGKAASAPASAPPGGYPPASAGIRADILGYPPSKWPARHILAGWKGFLPAGEVSFQLWRHMYLASWKGFLPAVEVHVPRRPEGSPSCRRGTRTLSTGRKSFRPKSSMFRSTRYMYLGKCEAVLPGRELRVTRRMIESLSGRESPLDALDFNGGTLSMRNTLRGGEYCGISERRTPVLAR
ncbi:uncharacterized protein PGTG_10648 [Puccinia graminis f. sp. tritici CRL 75-36-700-3]|uniref:Uncharacterized protein n=1 Tax=Puccinia graminis f. sp. tritici (strain CRL 75-36-700-3 / race SCCL) TaxID=418459 RepID=E3KIZ5_PUCGT|nr:uncharacterized protein PGTG_10648 [Puccinia graminis f. sp. tritici CRL 75-36-700-3]EFP84270.1 hypothetical protein PGTG_10648 [Puccinia graminis f. sp. tritici CRL 75-36-700-3]